VLRVGGEVVPEMLEVDALASGDEFQRRLAVEVEVPLVAQQPYRLPVADAGQERVHQHDAFDLVRILRRVRIRDHQADVVADDLHLRKAELVHERMDVLRQRLLVVAIGRFRRSAVAAQIRRDDDTAIVQLRYQRQPHVAGFRIAVQQDDRCFAALSGFQIVQFDTVDAGGVALYGRCVRLRVRGDLHRRAEHQCDAGLSQPSLNRVHGHPLMNSGLRDCSPDATSVFRAGSCHRRR
jgi:hypothetical protein